MASSTQDICRILLMVPIYAIDAAVSIRFMQEAIILNTVRELYEAFTVWSFMSLILEFLHNEAVRSKDRGLLQPSEGDATAQLAEQVDELDEKVKEQAMHLAELNDSDGHKKQAQVELRLLQDQLRQSMSKLQQYDQLNRNRSADGGDGAITEVNAVRARSTSAVQDRMDLITELLATQPDEPHVFGVRQLLRCTPKCCGIRAPWRMGAVGPVRSQFLHRCRLGVLQFVPMQILVSVLCVILETQNVYQEGVWINQKLASPYRRWPTGFGCVNLIRIISCTYALYCLVYFYKGTKNLLAPDRVGYNIQTLAKFMSIKLVVFATFWQKMVFTIGTKLGHLLGPRLPIFYTYNFKNVWINILVTYFNSVGYFVVKGDDYGDGQTHHGCNCVGYTDGTDGPRNDNGFTYGNKTWGQTWGIRHGDKKELKDGVSFRCNMILPSLTCLYLCTFVPQMCLEREKSWGMATAAMVLCGQEKIGQAGKIW